MTLETTLVKDLPKNNLPDVSIDETGDSEKDVFNFSLPHEQRIAHLKRVCATSPTESIENVVQRLLGMFIFTKTSALKRFIHAAAVECDIPLLNKFDCLHTLCDKSKPNDIGTKLAYDGMRDLCIHMNEIPFVYAIDTLASLHGSQQHRDTAVYHLDALLVHNTKVDVEQRYRALLSLFDKLHDDGVTYQNCLVSFVSSPTTHVRYRILGCQTLFIKCTMSPDRRQLIEETCLAIARDTQYDVDTRADATDTILRNGSEESIAKATALLHELGGRTSNIYMNQQNAHTKEIDESALCIIEYMQKWKRTKVLRMGKRKSANMTFDEAKRALLDRVDSDHDDVITTALLRISFDHTRFGATQLTLKDIFCLLCDYINDRPDKSTINELYKRLVEELADMAGTCTTGYVNRLANVLSGHEGLSLSVSWEDQIRANLQARINKRIMDMDDDDEQEDILNDMTESDYRDRKSFNSFVAKVLPIVKEELYQEFREYMDDTDWDLYFGKAVIEYQKN